MCTTVRVQKWIQPDSGWGYPSLRGSWRRSPRRQSWRRHTRPKQHRRWQRYHFNSCQIFFGRFKFFLFFRPQCQRTPLQPHRHTKRARRSWSRAARRWQRLKKAKRGGVGYWIKLLQNKYPQLFDNLQKSKLMNHDILNDGMDADCQSKNSFFF